MAILRPNVIALTLLVALATAGCSDVTTNPHNDATGNVVLRFTPTFDGVVLTAGTKVVTTGEDTLSFSTLKFYASEFDFEPVASHGHHGAELLRVDSIFLIDLFGDESARSFTLPTNAVHYESVAMSIGVPEVENHKDAATQTEPLGPNVGMYWGWDPGYIFFKVEGFVDSSGTSLPFVFHCGEDARKKRVVLAGTDHIVVERDAIPVVTVTVALDQFFEKGVIAGQPLRLRDHPESRRHHKGPAELADLTAENFATLFRVAE